MSSMDREFRRRLGKIMHSDRTELQRMEQQAVVLKRHIPLNLTRLAEVAQELTQLVATPGAVHVCYLCRTAASTCWKRGTWQPCIPRGEDLIPHGKPQPVVVWLCDPCAVKVQPQQQQQQQQQNQLGAGS